jgi:ribosomal protein S10
MLAISFLDSKELIQTAFVIPETVSRMQAKIYDPRRLPEKTLPKNTLSG